MQPTPSTDGTFQPGCRREREALEVGMHSGRPPVSGQGHGAVAAHTCLPREVTVDVVDATRPHPGPSSWPPSTGPTAWAADGTLERPGHPHSLAGMRLSDSQLDSQAYVPRAYPYPFEGQLKSVDRVNRLLAVEERKPCLRQLETRKSRAITTNSSAGPVGDGGEGGRRMGPEKG